MSNGGIRFDDNGPSNVDWLVVLEVVCAQGTYDEANGCQL